MNGQAIIERIRAKNMLPATAKIGVRGIFSKSAKIDADGRTLEVIATTNDIDLDDEVVLPGGADPSYFAKNGKLFVDHQYRTQDVVGTLRALTPFSRVGGGAGWKMRAYMIPGLPMADAVLAIAEAGGIGWSIGFEAIDYGKPTVEEAKSYKQGDKAPLSIIRKWRWLETSATPFPCNVACQTMNMVQDESKMALLDELVTKSKITREAAEAFGLRTKMSAPKVIRCVVRKCA
jgi:hypothetical protein